jgi:hypothetical protein
MQEHPGETIAQHKIVVLGLSSKSNKHSFLYTKTKLGANVICLARKIIPR